MLSPEACMLKLIHLCKLSIIQYFSIIDGLRTVVPTIQSIQCFLNDMSMFIAIAVLIMEGKINCNLELIKAGQIYSVFRQIESDCCTVLFLFYIKLCFVLA